jgi:translation initiation factor 2B subunit (eIF-2B alpha/beta/delta family)/ADP-ribose pyrophosphatase YjhB (NUDIX family)
LNRQFVVTAFVESQNEILLLKRAKNAATYSGKWSAISGYPRPGEALLDAAYREIEEEIGLGRPELTFLAEGEKLPVYDDQSETLWIVKPFRFSTRTKSVRLAPENETFQWSTEESLLKLETVSKLIDAYHRTRLLALEDAYSEAKDFTRQITDDYEHGAAWLASEALTAMKVISMRVEAESPSEFVLKLTHAGKMLMSARPAIAAIRNLLGQFLFALHKKSNELDVNALRPWAASYTLELQSRSRDAMKTAATIAARLIAPSSRVLTHSYSSTVKEALLTCSREGRLAGGYVTESMPLGEGRRLAKELRDLGVELRVIPDSAASAIVNQCALVLVGADSIQADGTLINKVGTIQLALAAKRYGISFYSIAETTKFALNSLAEGEIRTENFRDATTGDVPLFDVTPADCVTGFVTEAGVMQPHQVEVRMCGQLQRTYL